MSESDKLTELRWKKFQVLDDGFICLVDAMGSDDAICDAARVSYGAGTRKTSKNPALIDYLMRHEHMSPFEMAELKFLVRVPMDVWRQWVRHRTASINEYSTRYSEAIDSMVKTDPTKWRKQSKTNKQGSDTEFLSEEVGKELSAEEAALHEQIRAFYQKCLDLGVAREQARKNLPLCTYTEAYWKCDLRNILHFMTLRTDVHAQEEIRQYATVIGYIVSKLFPLTWMAWCRHCSDSVTFSVEEWKLIQKLPILHPELTMPKLKEMVDGIYTAPDYKPWNDENPRKRDEFLTKMLKLGVGDEPWEPPAFL